MSLSAAVALLLTLAVCGRRVAGSADDGRRNSSFAELLRYEQRTELARDDFAPVLKTLFGRFSCGVSPCPCTTALNSSVLFDLAGVETHLDQSGYGRLSVILLHDLYYDLDRCTVAPPGDLLDYRNYTDWLAGLSDGGMGADFLDLLTVLRGKYKNVKDGGAVIEGKENTMNTCLDQRKLSKLMNISQSTPNATEEIASWIVLDLIMGVPMAYSCSGLPYPKDILADLWNRIPLSGDQPLDLVEFQDLLHKLDIGGYSDKTAGVLQSDRKKRSAIQRLKQKLNHSVQKRQANPISLNCFTAAELLGIYGVDVTSGVSRDDLLRLLPAFVQQQLSESCSSRDGPADDKVLPSAKERYGYGTVSVLIISLVSLLGLFIAPAMKSRSFAYVISFMIALAVGTLLGDAMMHLIPQAFGIHDEDNEHEHEPGSGITLEPFLVKSLAILGAVYLFLFLQTLLEWGSGVSHHHGHSHGELTSLETENGQSNGEAKSNGVVAHEAGSNKSLEVQNTCNGTKAVGWMIIVGDGLHNLGDGLAIGAAFTVNTWSGLSTSLAVLCHEIPHELGDMAVLLNAGMSVKRALLLNFLSATMAFVGLYVGLSISAESEARDWIFTIAAGMFIYLALANMVPELMSLQSEGNRCIMFLLQNLGFCAGVAIMLVIALYEEKIVISRG